MRRLAIIFAVIASVSAFEQVARLAASHSNRAHAIGAPRRIRQSLRSLRGWRAFLVGPMRLFQRTSRGVGLWLGQSD